MSWSAPFRTGSANGVTSAADTTGATFIAVAVTSIVALPTLTDSAGNTWQHITSAGPSSGTQMYTNLFYCIGPTTSASHTFNPGNSAYGCEYQCFNAAGTITLDQQAQAAFTSAVSSMQAGSITPSANGALVIAANKYEPSQYGASCGSGFTTTSSLTANYTVNYGGGMAYLIQATAAAINPTWTWANGNATGSALIASFIIAASGPTINTQPSAQTAKIGASATWSVAATTSGGTLHYAWTFNGVSVGTDSASYTRAGVVLADHGHVAQVAVTDSNGTTTSATAALTVAVTFSGTVGSQSGTVGTAYSLDLSSYFAGGLSRTYSVLSGALPAGVTQTGTTAAFSGTPSTAGSGSFVVRATDANGNHDDTNSISWTIASSGGSTPVSFSGTVPAQSGTTGGAFSLSLAGYFSGTLTPFSYAAYAGSLAGTGLSLNASTGVLSGTLGTVGSYTFAAQATDTGSNAAHTNTFAITISAASSGAYSATAGPFALNTGSGPALGVAVSWTAVPGDAGATSGTPVNGSGSTDASTGLLTLAGLNVTGTHIVTVKNADGSKRWHNVVTAA